MNRRGLFGVFSVQLLVLLLGLYNMRYFRPLLSSGAAVSKEGDSRIRIKSTISEKSYNENSAQQLPDSIDSTLLGDEEGDGIVDDASTPAELKKQLTVVEILNHWGPQGKPQSICDALKEAFNSSYPENKEEDRRVVYRHNHCGDKNLGNRVLKFYNAHLLASSVNASFAYICEKDDDMAQNATNEAETVMSLLMKLHESPEKDTENLVNRSSIPPLSEICSGLVVKSPAPLDPLAEIIRRDFRTVASKVRPKVVASDVAIHYRCGDVLMTSNKKYGLLPHATFGRLILEEFGANSTPRSIKIVTQPYEKQHLRPRDIEFGARCKLIVEDFLSWLKDEFPASKKIKVYNDPTKETLARTYAHLTMANRATICGSSTFCVLPTVASRGTGYVYKSDLFPWVQEMERHYDDVKTYESPKLVGSKAMEMSDKDLLAWLRSN